MYQSIDSRSNSSDYKIFRFALCSTFLFSTLIIFSVFSIIVNISETQAKPNLAGAYVRKDLHYHHQTAVTLLDKLRSVKLYVFDSSASFSRGASLIRVNGITLYEKTLFGIPSVLYRNYVAQEIFPESNTYLQYSNRTSAIYKLQEDDVGVNLTRV